MNKQLSIISAENNLRIAEKKSNTLISRGLGAIQNNALSSEQDKRYQKARIIFYQIIRCSWYFFEDENYWTTEKEIELRSCFTTFNTLAEKNYGKAYFPLSMMFKIGKGVAFDGQKAILYAQLAFEWCFENQFQDDPEIWSDLGMLYRWGEVVEANYPLAFFWFKKAAEKNDAQAEFCLGLMYQYGRGTKKDIGKAFYWYTKAADLGYCDISFCQGFIDRIKFAEQGNKETQFELACDYLYGEDNDYIEQDYELAFYWCRKAAEQGHMEAQFFLGCLYNDGIVEKTMRRRFSGFKRRLNKATLMHNTI